MSKFCPNCGNEVNDNKFCPNCGTAQGSSSQQQPQTQPPAMPNQNQYSNQVNYSQNHQPKKKNYGCVIGILVFIVVIIITVVASIIINYETEKVMGKAMSQNQIEVTESFSKVTGLTNEQAEKIMKILKECGVTIKSISADENLNDLEKEGCLGYRIKTTIDINAILYLNSDGTLLAVKHADQYMYKDGKAIKTLNQILNPPNLEIVGEVTDKGNQYSRYICGTVRNNSNKKYSYVQITFAMYDEKGNKVGSALANVNNLDSGETWSFEALSTYTGAGSYKLDELTGF